MAKYSLEEKVRLYLSEIAVDPKVTPSIEGRMKGNLKGRRVWVWIIVVVFIGLVIGGQFLVAHYIDSSDKVFFIVLLVANFLPFIFLFSMVWAYSRAYREYGVFTSLVACIRKMDEALIQSPAISKERQELAIMLLRCSRRMRAYRSLVPLSLDKRIRNEQVLRASFALRAPVRLVMLGDAEELVSVKGDLARAAIRIGTTNWTQVGNLVGDIPKPARTRARIQSLLPILALAIPLISTIITVFSKLYY